MAMLRPASDARAAFDVLISSSAFAQSASLAQGMNELVTLYEADSPKLASVLKQHVTASDGDVLVNVRLKPGGRVDQALPVLALQGFRLQAVSALDASLLEGFLPLWATRSVAWSGSLKSISQPYPRTRCF